MTQNRPTHELIVERQVLLCLDHQKAAVLEVEIARRGGTIDTEGYEPPEQVLYDNPATLG